VGRTLDVTKDDVVVRLSGWTALAALRRELRLPLRAITAVSTERYARDGLRLGGTSVPFSEIRAGRFRRDRMRTFLSFHDRDCVVTLALDRSAAGLPYDLVAVGVDDPAAVAAEVERRRAKLGIH
jgi:hypothetical protein